MLFITILAYIALAATTLLIILGLIALSGFGVSDLDKVKWAAYERLHGTHPLLVMMFKPVVVLWIVSLVWIITRWVS